MKTSTIVIIVVVVVVLIALIGFGIYWYKRKREHFCCGSTEESLATMAESTWRPHNAPVNDSKTRSGGAYFRVSEENDYFPPLAVVNEMREVQKVNGTMSLNGPFVAPLSTRPWYNFTDPRPNSTPQEQLVADLTADSQNPVANNGEYMTMTSSWAKYPSTYPQSQPEVTEQCTIDNVIFCQMSDGRPGTCNLGLCNPSFMPTR